MKPIYRAPKVFLSILLMAILVFGCHLPNRADRLYLSGDREGSAKIWKEWAEQGQASAQSHLGFLYTTGQGVPQDHNEAAKWYRKAAEQGYPPAQYKLGVMYSIGRGVPQDYIQAHKWFNFVLLTTGFRSERNLAVEKLKNLEKNMTPSQIAEGQKPALEWIEKHREDLQRRWDSKARSELEAFYRQCTLLWIRKGNSKNCSPDVIEKEPYLVITPNSGVKIVGSGNKKTFTATAQHLYGPAVFTIDAKGNITDGL